MAIELGVHSGPQRTEMAELIRLWKRADAGGFGWISAWDHFYAFPMQDKNDPCYEGVSTLAALAAVTTKAKVGCLMFCSLYRHPSLLAKAAATIDHISNGRLNLGIGAGWYKQEFDEFGYRFPPIGERFEHLEETLQIVRGLFQEPSVTFAGRHYQLKDAVCAPKPMQPRVPLWVGGRGPQRTPATAARFADGFNAPFLSPQEYAKRLQVVDETCAEIKRDPASVRRTVNVGFFMGADAKSAAQNRERLQQLDPAQREGAVVGTAQEVIDRMQEYVKIGVQGINLSVRPPIDWDALDAFIEQVMPQFQK